MSAVNMALPDIVLNRRVYSTEPPVRGTGLYSHAEPVPRLTPKAAIFRRRSQPTVSPLAPKDWKLHFEGLVERREPLGIDELQGGFRPMHRAEVAHMCAGDGREAMGAKGTQWLRGDSMSAFETEGVTLGAILNEAKVQPGARYVTVVSRDGFQNRYDLQAAMHPRILVASAINGEQLSSDLGGPVRIVARGSYGVRSPGDIERVIVSAEKIETRVNDHEYRYLYGEPTQGSPVPVDEIKVISHIVNVQPGDSIPSDAEIIVRAGVGSTHRIPRTIEEVVFSTDGGETWDQLDVLDDPRENMWSYGVIAASRFPHGPVSVVTKARDSRGVEQPSKAKWNSGGYGNNGWDYPTVFEVAA